LENLIKLLQREHFGLALRVFAGKPEAVAAQCDRALALARTAANMRVANRAVFETILIMVAADTRRVDRDYGLSIDYLKKKLAGTPSSHIIVVNCDREDLFCGIPNRAAGELLRRGCRYMTMWSHAAGAYLDESFLESAALAFSKGASVVGLAITELQESILEGRIANTCAVWDAEHLVSVGGFDHFAEQPFEDGHRGLFTDERLVHWVQGMREGDRDAFYPEAGVEEIIPLIRLARKFDRPCITPIMPSDGKVWELPTDPNELARHQKKMATKRVRQEGMARHVNADLGVLQDAVMDGYGWKASV
jgi:hypothetical protein